jgi:hypothetical protein
MFKFIKKYAAKELISNLDIAEIVDKYLGQGEFDAMDVYDIADDLQIDRWIVEAIIDGL